MQPNPLKRHLPNAVTILRGLMGPTVIIVLQLNPGKLAFFLFISAMLSDLLDGWLAVRLDAQSDIGRFLDPLADKVLTNSVWLGLWAIDWAPAWLALPMILRDVLVAALWAWTTRRGAVWHANLPGRLMATFEGISLGVLLFHGPWLNCDWPAVGIALGMIALLLAAHSGWLYAAGGSTRTPRPGRW